LLETCPAATPSALEGPVRQGCPGPPGRTRRLRGRPILPPPRAGARARATSWSCSTKPG